MGHQLGSSTWVGLHAHTSLQPKCCLCCAQCPCTGLPCWGALQPVPALLPQPLLQPEWAFCGALGAALPANGVDELSLLCSGAPWGCRCSMLRTQGDRAFVEFLSDEIKEEEKRQKCKSLPKMSGSWELEVNGTEAKVVGKVAREKIIHCHFQH